MTKPNTTVPVLSQKLVARFWSRVDVRGPDDCWLWTRGTVNGYGQFRVGKRKCGAHVIARFLTTGEWRGEFCTCHNCPSGDNRLCCNPAHLWLGTEADNIADRGRKGRTNKGDKHWTRLHPEKVPRGDNHGSRLHPETVQRGINHHTHLHPEKMARGEDNGSAILTEEQIREIRRLRAAGHKPGLLSAKFHVHRRTIWAIVTFRIWKHVS